MIPFPYLRRIKGTQARYFEIYAKIASKKWEYGYYIVDGNFLVGKNGRISIDEFLQIIVRDWKSRECGQKTYINHNPVHHFELLIGFSDKVKVCLTKKRIQILKYYDVFLKKALKENFLSQDRFGQRLNLVFDNEKYIGMFYP